MEKHRLNGLCFFSYSKKILESKKLIFIKFGVIEMNVTQQQAVNIAISIVEEMRDEYVPRDTGNMAYLALQYEFQNGILAIYINPDIAPYVPYTNEPWLSDKWHSKKNPNEGWWDRFVEEFSKRLAKKLKGVIK